MCQTRSTNRLDLRQGDVQTLRGNLNELDSFKDDYVVKQV